MLSVVDYIEKYELKNYFSNDVSAYFTLHTFSKGEMICRMDEPLKTLYFFVEGRAKVYRSLENGKQLLLCFYEPMQMVGDLEVLRGGCATTNMETLTECICIGISFETIQNELSNDVTFFKCICDSLGQKLDRLSKNSTVNLLSPVESRIASYIIKMAVENTSGELIFEGNITQIAEFLGTSFRHLHRTLQHLCIVKILKKKSTTYTVVDFKRLKELSQDVY